MTHKAKIYVNLVFIILLGMVMVAWVLLKLIGNGGLEDPFRVTAEFENSGGVFTDQEVTYRGVTVGRVGELALSEDGVTIELFIDPRWEEKIPSTVTAAVRSKSAVGEQFVNLTPAGTSAESLVDGDVIPRARTSVPVDFQELLKSLDKVLADVPPGRTNRLVGNLADGLGGRSDEIRTILESLGVLSDTFADLGPAQQRLLDNSTRAGEAFLRTKENFAAALRAADDVFAGIGDEPEELAALFRENDAFARSAINLLARRGDDLGEGIRALADFNEFQLDNRDLVEAGLEYTPQVFKAIELASVPWRSPGGSEFYRIRIGVVEPDMDPTSWPCKYVRPLTYQRLPHVRDDRDHIANTNCEPEPITAARSEAEPSLVTALEEWAATEPEVEARAASVPLAFPEGTLAEAPQFGWPAAGVVTSGYGPRWGRMHEGVDIDGVTGDPIVAAAAGTVVTAGWHDGYGNMVVIDHGNGFATLYAHLSEISLEGGALVPAGELVGLMGCTGSCTGDHLHFEIRKDGIALDPVSLLPGGSLFIGNAAPLEE